MHVWTCYLGGLQALCSFDAAVWLDEANWFGRCAVRRAGQYRPGSLVCLVDWERYDSNLDMSVVPFSSPLAPSVPPSVFPSSPLSTSSVPSANGRLVLRGFLSARHRCPLSKARATVCEEGSQYLGNCHGSKGLCL